MKNFERTLPNQLGQQIYNKADQFDTGIGKLERAYSFNQALENYPNHDQSNDNIRETNPKIFGNSQEISRIDGDHGSFQDLCDNVTDPLSSIKRQTLFDNESVQESNYKVQNKIKSVVSHFQIHQFDSSEQMKGIMTILQTLSIFSFSQSLQYSSIQFVYGKNKNLRFFEQNIQISLESQKHFINQIYSNQQKLIKNNDTAEFKSFFSFSKNVGIISKSKSFYFKEINEQRSHYVYDIKLQTLQLKQIEPQLSEIPLIDPIVDKQKKRLLEEQKQKEVKINSLQDNQKQIEQKFNLDFTKLFQQVDESIIQPQYNNLQKPFNIQNQNFLTNPNIFNNFTNSNPFSNILNNNQQGFVQTNFNTMSNTLPLTKNSLDSNKSKSYNTRSGRS
ncbi:unnamed protein product [Paramecium pentaurelia]|uniref:Uncharacterized protein n=1 Tax=Paramecium pentaurelia TaxID=43138 RepID=A0A8S1U1D3_9CILI|nr:unnamed protein product [Paramecium pentaurelia]